MTFVYFPREFYIISNALAYKTLILNYNRGFNLCIFLFIYLFLFTYLGYDFSNLILYIFDFYFILFDLMVRPMTHWLNQ